MSETLKAEGQGTYTFSNGVTIEVPPLTFVQATQIYSWLAEYEQGRVAGGSKLLDWFARYVDVTALDGLSPAEMIEEIVRFFLSARTKGPPAGDPGAAFPSAASSTSSSSSTPASVDAPPKPRRRGGRS